MKESIKHKLLVQKRAVKEAGDYLFVFCQMYGFRGTLCFILWTHQIALLGNDDRGSSNRQKASGQHKLQASNS